MPARPITRVSGHGIEIGYRIRVYVCSRPHDHGRLGQRVRSQPSDRLLARCTIRPPPKCSCQRRRYGRSYQVMPTGFLTFLSSSHVEHLDTVRLTIRAATARNQDNGLSIRSGRSRDLPRERRLQYDRSICDVAQRKADLHLERRAPTRCSTDELNSACITAENKGFVGQDQ
jgi:hypothetical protein